MEKFKFLFKVVMACLYMLLGIYISLIKTDEGPLGNNYVRISFGIILVVYGLFRAYNLSKQYQDFKNGM